MPEAGESVPRGTEGLCGKGGFLGHVMNTFSGLERLPPCVFAGVNAIKVEPIVTIGVKEGPSHLILVTIRPGDVVFTPNPTYPIHPFSAIIAGGDVRGSRQVT